jgi:hypothetical protein
MSLKEEEYNGRRYFGRGMCSLLAALMEAQLFNFVYNSSIVTTC